MSGTKGHSGGPRPGSGRKPKRAVERAVMGEPGHRPARVLQHSPAGAVPVVAGIEEFEAPDDLTMEERRVWLELAPHGFAKRTLTAATALSFRLLCRNVVLERALAVDVEQRGGSNHRGMIQRVDAELLRFDLSPCGKPIYQEEPEAKLANPLAKFLKRG